MSSITTTGTKLRRLRALNQLNANSVAQRTEIPMSQLFLFEADDAYPSDVALQQLADLYNVSLEALEDDNTPLGELVNLNDYFPDMPVLVLNKTAEDIEKEREIVASASSRRERLQSILDLYNISDELAQNNLAATVEQLLSVPEDYDRGSYLTEYLQLAKIFSLDPDYFTDGKTAMTDTDANEVIPEEPHEITTEPAEVAQDDTRTELEKMALKYPTIGERLKFLRDQSQWTNAAQVAAATDNAFSGAVLRNMEKGITAPNEERKLILARVYGINPDVLSAETIPPRANYVDGSATTPPSAPMNHVDRIEEQSSTVPSITPTKEVTARRSKTLRLNRIYKLAEELFSNPEYTEQDMQQLVQTLDVLRRGR